MKLNTLHSKQAKSKKRVGRGIGSSKGKTSGRGHKGQKSRSGVSLKGFEGGQMPLYRRLPKRGFKNIYKTNFNFINLVQIQNFINKKKIDLKEEITEELLLKKKIIKKKLDGLKILGKGDIKSKIIIQAQKASKNAIKKIEKVGGKVNMIKAISNKKKKDINIDKDSIKKKTNNNNIKK